MEPQPTPLNGAAPSPVAQPVQAAPAAAPGQAPAAVTPPQPAPGQAPASEWRNPAEIKQALKDARATLARLEAIESAVDPSAVRGQQPAAPAQGVDVVSQAVLEVSIGQVAGLTADQVGILRTLHAAEKPPAAGMGEWLKQKLVALGRAPQQAPAGTTPPAAGTPPAQSQARTDLGTPGAVPGGVLSDDPTMIPPDIWKSMDPTERHKITKKWVAKSSGNNSGLLRRNAK